MVALVARRTLLPARRSEAVTFDEDVERALRHHCPLCDTMRTFLECRLTGRHGPSVWLPNLRFCIECGTVLHIEEVRVEK